MQHERNTKQGICEAFESLTKLWQTTVDSAQSSAALPVLSWP
jgi:hypothetical protein